MRADRRPRARAEEAVHLPSRGSGRGREGAEEPWLETRRREIRSPRWAMHELQGYQRERVRTPADDKTAPPREGVPQGPAGDETWSTALNDNPRWPPFFCRPRALRLNRCPFDFFPLKS